MLGYNYTMFNPQFNQYSTDIIPADGGLKARGEFYVQVLYYNQLIPKYLISNMGKVYCVTNDRFCSQSPDKDGYKRVCIKDDSWPKYKTVKVHRLMLMTFKPLPSANQYDKLVVNHIDGCKDHNFIDNLEWTTVLDNTRHAWKTGLIDHTGEKHHNSVYSNETINTFCQMIDEGKSNSEIADYFGITEIKERMRIMSTLSSIRYGKTHLDISSKYNFMRGVTKMNPSGALTHLLCMVLSNGNTYTYDELADMLNIAPEKRISFANYVSALVDGDTGLEISRNYRKLKKPLRTKS